MFVTAKWHNGKHENDLRMHATLRPAYRNTTPS
jgi:hypothetical protein